jgi:hypothetical protein
MGVLLGPHAVVLF